MKNQYVYFLLIVLLNIISSSVSTLKTIFVSKQVGRAVYLIVFLDATIYSLVLKSFSSDGSWAVAAYIIGKVIGAVVADGIEKKLAIGINDIVLYVGSSEIMMQLQDNLIQHGYSTTANVGLIDELNPRYSLNVQVSRKDMNNFLKLLRDSGVEEPTMTVHELKKVSGKIAERI